MSKARPIFVLNDNFSAAEIEDLDELLQQVLRQQTDAAVLIQRVVGIAAELVFGGFGLFGHDHRPPHIRSVPFGTPMSEEIWSADGCIYLGDNAARGLLADVTRLSAWYLHLTVANYGYGIGGLPALRKMFRLHDFPAVALNQTMLALLNDGSSGQVEGAFRRIHRIRQGLLFDVTDTANQHRDPGVISLLPLDRAVASALAAETGEYQRFLCLRLLVAVFVSTIAHECSHILLGHDRAVLSDPDESYRAESEADRSSLEMLLRNGFEFDAYCGLQVFRSVHARDSRRHLPGTHPASTERVRSAAHALQAATGQWQIHASLDDLRGDLEVELAQAGPNSSQAHAPWRHAWLSAATTSAGIQVALRVRHPHTSSADSEAWRAGIEFAVHVQCAAVTKDGIQRTAWVSIDYIPWVASFGDDRSLLSLFKATIYMPVRWRELYPEASLTACCATIPGTTCASFTPPVGAAVDDVEPAEAYQLSFGPRVSWYARREDLVSGTLPDWVGDSGREPDRIAELNLRLQWTDDTRDAAARLEILEALFRRDPIFLRQDFVYLALEQYRMDGAFDKAEALVNACIAHRGRPGFGMFRAVAEIALDQRRYLSAINYANLENWTFGGVIGRFADEAEDVFIRAVKAIDAKAAPTRDERMVLSFSSTNMRLSAAIESYSNVHDRRALARHCLTALDALSVPRKAELSNRQLRAEMLSELGATGLPEMDERAVDAFTALRQLAPWFGPAYIQQALVYHRQGRHELARQLLCEVRQHCFIDGQLAYAQRVILGEVTMPLPWDFFADDPHFLAKHIQGQVTYETVSAQADSDTRSLET
ncbi:hypothetical protein [Nocardia beijingensis]